MFGKYINNLIEYIKKTYNFIYNNYNYKQILLILSVFITIYIVELLNQHNANILQLLPVQGLPTGIQGVPTGIQEGNNKISIQKLSKETKTTVKNNKSNKRLNKGKKVKY